MSGRWREFAALLALASCAAPAGDPRADLERLLAGHVELPEPGEEPSVPTAATLLADGLDEGEAVRVALLENRELRALLHELEVARGDFESAVAGANPELEVEWLLDGGGSALEVSLVQDVIDLLRRPARSHVARADLDAAVARVAERVLAIVSEARLAWVDALAATRRAELAHADLAVAAAQLDLALRIRAAGNSAELDALASRAAHEEARLAASVAERAAVAARERLNAALGLWGERALATVEGRLPELPPADPPIEDVERRAVVASLDLGARRRGLDAAAGRVGLARAEGWLPEAELGAQGDGEGSAWAFGPVVALPLPLLDRGTGARRRTSAELARDAERLVSAAVTLRAEARVLASEVAALGAEARFVRDVLGPLRRAITEQALLHYNAMQIGAAELLDARREEFLAEARLLEATQSYWRARVALDALLAGGRAPAAAIATTPASGTEPRAARGDGEAHG